MAPDHVDRILAQWRAERPELDPAPIGLIGRLHRLGQTLRTEVVRVYREHGLGEGEFDVLATLRRNGPDHALIPRDLAEQTMVTSGAMTKRIDRLEAEGLVERRPSPEDGRGRLIVLTTHGREVIDRAYEAHLANEHRLVAGLDADQRAALESLLRTWARSIEG